MKIIFTLLLVLAVFAAERKRTVFKTETIPLDQALPSIPNFVVIDDSEYKRNHHKITYDQDSFTSERTKELKIAQNKQDFNLRLAIQHSQQQ